MTKLRVILTRAFLPVFTAFVVLVPSQAYAFVPASVGGYGLPPTSISGAVGGAAAASAGAVDLFAAAGLIAIGASISYFAIDYAVSGTQYDMRIPLTAAGVVPPPAAAATASSTSMFYVPYNGNAACGASDLITADGGGACSMMACQWAKLSQNNFTNQSGTYVSPQTCNMVGTYNGTQYSTSATIQKVTACPSGYTSSGGICNLSNARAATIDHACDLLRSGSALAMISDPDCAASGTAIPVICAATGTTCVGYGTAPNGGAPRSFVVTPTADGGTQVTTWQQSTATTGQTLVQQNDITVSPAGAVTAVNTSVSTGSIPAPSTTATAGTAAQVQPTTGTAVAPVIGGSSTTINLPTDYARQGEAATAAKTITDADTAWRNGENQRFQDRLGLPPVAEPIPRQSVPVSIANVLFTTEATCPADIPLSIDVGSAGFHQTYSISFAPMCNVMSMMRPLFLAFGAFSCGYIFIGGLRAS